MTIVNIGTYLPKQCGIATFSKDLYCSLKHHRQDVEIIAVSDGTFDYNYPASVKYDIRQNEVFDYIEAAQYINNNLHIKLAVVQHEYGIYGGLDGDFILELTTRLTKPYIVVTHTVLPEPLKHQQYVLNHLCSEAAATVCMTKRSAYLLKNIYGIASAAIRVINHGVPDFKKENPGSSKQRHDLNGKTVISTFGLISPSKGLESGIKTMKILANRFPEITYLILGQTHPNLKNRDGEAYRNMLENLVDELQLTDHVRFVNKFLSDEELNEYLNLTDIYLSPYPNKNQAVSGTLAFALGCGKAIVSTSYDYAREVLAEGRGLLASEANPDELARLIGLIIEKPHLKKNLEKKAYKLGKSWSWNNIGMQYCQLFRSQEKIEAKESLVNYVGL